MKFDEAGLTIDKALLKAVLEFAGTRTAKTMQQLWVEPSEGLIVASDGFSLCVASTPHKSDAPSYGVCRHALKTSIFPAFYKVIRICTTADLVRVYGGSSYEGRMIELLCRQTYQAGAFPPWREVLPERVAMREENTIAMNGTLLGRLANLQKVLGAKGVRLQFGKPTLPVRFDIEDRLGTQVFGALMPMR